MNDLARPEMLVPLLVGGLGALGASIAVWTWILGRAARGQAIVPYEPRRPVPWHAIDLLLVVLFFYVVLGAIADLDRWLFLGDAPAGHGPPQEGCSAQEDRPARDGKPTTEHALLVLLQEDRSLTVLAWCVLVAVVVAPIAEEVFFRLLVQGWLEAVERRWRRHIGFSRGALRGSFPVLLSSLPFAWLHAREAGPLPGPEIILHGLVCQMFANLATLGFALALVHRRVGATGGDLGFCRKEFARDVGLGAGAALAVVPWIYPLNFLLSRLLPEGVSADPYTLVPFAAVLGLLYYRTHRIVPAIVLHMALNATSVALAWSLVAPAR